MRKRNTALIILLSIILSTGCGPVKQGEPAITTESGYSEDETTETTTPEATTTDNEQSTTDDQNATEGSDNKDEIVTKTEYGDDGSISIVSTNSIGKVVETIDYDASKNTTIQFIYVYNQYGALLDEYNYEGNGNLIDEFSAGNYDNATSFGEGHYGEPDDHDVDLENAFDVTIEELAPLYQKAEAIWDKYGVAVLIADKVSSNTDGAALCYDYKLLERSLKLVESCLACYPDDFFRDFSDYGLDTTVCIQLVETGAAAGVYMYGYRYLLIQIDVNDYYPEDGYDDKGAFFCYTLHHEIFHMISDKLMERADRSEYPLTEEKWNSYNPDGFQYVGYYDDEKENKLYESGNNSDYFVTSYSCSTAEEDKAIIFGDAMTYYQGLETAVFNDYVDAKLKYLSDCMRAGFDSAEWPEKMPWDIILDY